MLKSHQKSPDNVSATRFDSEKAGDREVQRTMLELLNQLDGFSSTTDIKVIAATNRVDILDPALLRLGNPAVIVEKRSDADSILSVNQPYQKQSSTHFNDIGLFFVRSGRLDRKIEFPAPTEEARARIMQIHARKMNVSPDVNYDELARSTDDFNGAQCKVQCRARRNV